MPLPSFRDNVEALPKPAWILFGGTFINRFGTFVIPFLILYLTRIGYTSAQAGLAVGAYGAGHLVASFAGGHLADRIGRRNTIVLSMFGSAASMLALSQARSYIPIVILTCITGTLSELYRPASYALVGDLVGEEHRVTAFGIYRFAINLGFAAGPATAGFLADHSFTLLFIGDAATSIVYGFIALFALPHGLRTYVKSERTGEALRVAARDKPFIVFLLATLCITIVDFQMGSTFALHVRANGFPSSAHGPFVPTHRLPTLALRAPLSGSLAHAGLSDIPSRKDKQKVTVDIYTARPGIVIGKSGAEVDALRRELHDMTGKAVQVNITEIKRPEVDARPVAQPDPEARGDRPERDVGHHVAIAKRLYGDVHRPFPPGAITAEAYVPRRPA